MKKFQVTAKFTSFCTIEIAAENEDAAYLIAKDMDGGTFEPLTHDDWEISSVVEVPHMFTPDQLYFMDVYESACAAETRETVEAFFMMDDDDEFCAKYGTGAYGSIMDAYQVWSRAIDYARKIEKNN